MKNHIKLFFLSLMATGLMVALSCSKKQTECPDAEYYSNLKKSPPITILKSTAEEDPCEDERTALEQGVTDSIQYASDVRVGFLAMPDGETDPYPWKFYWQDLKSLLPSDPKLGDSIIAHREVADDWWNFHGDPLPNLFVDSLFKVVYNIGGQYLDQCDTMPFLREELKKCQDENPVGIEELEWDDWNDPCGGGQWVKTGKSITWEEAVRRYNLATER